MDWAQMRKMITEGLFNSPKKLEKFTILEVPSQILSEVAYVTVAVAKMGVKVDLMDKVLDEI